MAERSSKGDMFGLSLMGGRLGAKLLQPFVEAGQQFGKDGFISGLEILGLSRYGNIFRKADPHCEWPLRYIGLACAVLQKNLGVKTRLVQAVSRVIHMWYVGGNEDGTSS